MRGYNPGNAAAVGHHNSIAYSAAAGSEFQLDASTLEQLASGAAALASTPRRSGGAAGGGPHPKQDTRDPGEDPLLTRIRSLSARKPPLAAVQLRLSTKFESM